MKQNNIKVAVTGGIASGKSVVTKIFEKCGAKTVSADEINRGLLKRPEYLELLGKTFPQATESGKLDKSKLKELIFGDELLRKKLNLLAHPAIVAEIMRLAEQSTGIFVAEIPLLAESDQCNRFDIIVGVIAPKNQRISRICERDGVTEELAEKMIDAQPRDEEIIAISTFVIKNDTDLASLEALARETYQKIAVK